MRGKRLLVLLGVGCAAAGCASQRPAAEVDSGDPTSRLRAIREAARSDSAEDGSLWVLVRSLDSSDPAARMLAISALEARTGERLGYRHGDDAAVRDAAVRRWVDWVATTSTAAEERGSP